MVRCAPTAVVIATLARAAEQKLQNMINVVTRDIGNVDLDV